MSLSTWRFGYDHGNILAGPERDRAHGLADCLLPRLGSTAAISGPPDRLATWLAEAHQELAPTRVARRTRLGVALRSALIDTWCRELLLADVTPRAPWNVWALGAGLDARWDRLLPDLASRIREYREFDLPALLRAKRALVERSPLAGAYADVRTEPGDLLESLEHADPDPHPTLVVMEGVLMYFDKPRRERLLDLLRTRAPHCRLVVDLYTDVAARAANRQRKNLLGGLDVPFADAPTDIRRAFEDAGWVVHRQEALTPRVLARMPPWGWIPLPRSILDSYQLVLASPSPVNHHVA